MRKEFAATIRTVQVPKVQPKIRRLSLEEEALILDQANKDARDVENGMAEAHRQIEISEALEDLAVVAAGIRQATPVELDLIEAAGQMAVAGTDNEPELVLPAMEGFQEGKQIAFEDFKSKAALLWKNVLAFLKKIWDKITAFFKVNVVAIHYIGKFDLLIKQLSANPNAGKQGSISMDKLGGALQFNGQPVKSVAELLHAAKETEKMTEYVFHTYASHTVDRGDTASAAILAVSKSGLQEDTFKKLVNQLDARRLPSMPGAQEVRDNEKNFKTTESSAFLGGGVLTEHCFVGGDGYLTVTQALELQRTSGVTYRAGEDSPSASVQFALPNAAEMIQVLRVTQQLLKSITAYDNGILPQVKKIGAAMRSATELAVKKLESDPELDETKLAEFKSAVNFNQAFAEWTYQPAIPFYSALMRTARAVAMLAKEVVGAPGEGQQGNA